MDFPCSSTNADETETDIVKTGMTDVNNTFQAASTSASKVHPDPTWTAADLFAKDEEGNYILPTYLHGKYPDHLEGLIWSELPADYIEDDLSGRSSFDASGTEFYEVDDLGFANSSIENLTFANAQRSKDALKKFQDDPPANVAGVQLLHVQVNPQAGPYTPQDKSEDSGSLEDETDWSEEDDASLATHSPQAGPFVFTSLKQLLLHRVMQGFWEFYNTGCDVIVHKCIKKATSTSPGDSGSASQPILTSTQESSTSSLPQSNVQSSGALKRRRESGEEEEFPEEDKERPPSKRPRNSTSIAGSKRFACPFRKHNPRRYNMYQHKTCALSPFDTIARAKEHLYRHHRSAIQCVRCWLFFKDEPGLDTHLSVENICARRPGERSEGVTPLVERQLRSRKKGPPGQTEEDRWKDIYRMLFPDDEEVPSPYHEPIQDDAAQQLEPAAVSIEDFIRQEVPIIFRHNVEAEVNELHLISGSPTLGLGTSRDAFFDRLTSIVAESQDAAILAYKSKHAPSSSYKLPASVMTPLGSDPLSSFGSTVSSLRSSLTGSIPEIGSDTSQEPAPEASFATALDGELTALATSDVPSHSGIESSQRLHSGNPTNASFGWQNETQIPNLRPESQGDMFIGGDSGLDSFDWAGFFQSAESVKT